MIFTVNQRLDADVIVVGGGPAGSATATHLARGGVDTLVVERRAFPRDKVCGDFVSPTALWELRQLSSSLTLDDANAVTSAALYLDGRLLVEQDLPWAPDVPPLGRVVPRVRLDAAIAEVARSAGARFLEQASVTRVEPQAGCVSVELAGGPRRTLRARAVVGADGSNSLVGRVVRGGKVPRGDRIIALRGYFADVVGSSNKAELFFSRESFPGYCWSFPTEPGVANVGIGMAMETFPSQTMHLRDVLQRLRSTDPALRHALGRAQPTTKLVGWPLTTYNPHLPLTRDRLLLVGDAAGLINPINGEGIQYALASARWAAETLLGAQAAGGFSSQRLEAYQHQVAGHLQLDMAVARVISRLIANRLLNPFWLLALEAITARALGDPMYAQSAGGVLVGLYPTNRATRPDFAAATVETTALALCRALVARLDGADPASLAREVAKAVGSAASARDDLIAWARSSSTEIANFVITAAEATRF